MTGQQKRSINLPTIQKIICSISSTHQPLSLIIAQQNPLPNNKKGKVKIKGIK
jgi:hypothetical protein